MLEKLSLFIKNIKIRTLFSKMHLSVGRDEMKWGRGRGAVKNRDNTAEVNKKFLKFDWNATATSRERSCHINRPTMLNIQKPKMFYSVFHYTSKLMGIFITIGMPQFGNNG